MEKESIEQEEKKQVAMVECPFCNKPIEAPVKADVIFECPHCRKELITYDKKTKFQEQSMKYGNDYIKRKNVLKWGGVAALICFFVYICIITYAPKPDKNAICIITKEYNAAIDIETEKALVRASVDGDNMKILEIVGDKRTVHFNRGDRVKIIRDVVRGLPDHYRVERLSDGASALIPYKYLIEE